jgi:hypothetical protein
MASHLGELHLTRAFGALLYRGFFASVRGLAQNGGAANPARASELRRSTAMAAITEEDNESS